MNAKARKKLQQAFEIIDIDKDKTISWEEIKLCLKKLDMTVSRRDYLAFVKSDTNHDERLDFEEFCEFALMRLQKVFNEIDRDGNGKLDVYEIQVVLQKLSIDISLRKIESILKGMDKDGDAAVDFEEFCDFFADLPTFDMRHVAERWLSGIGIDVGIDQISFPMPPVETPLYRFMLAGGIGVAASRTAVAPLEKVKMLSEISSSGRVKVFQTVKRIFTREGIRGLYAGNFTNCVRLLPNGAIVGLVYSNMIKYTPVDNIKDPYQPHWRFLSGAAAGLLSNMATFPLDVIRTRLTVQDSSKNQIKRYNGIINTGRMITAQEGFRGLYKGMTPALISIVPFVGLQQSIYDVLKLQVVDTDFDKHLVTYLTCGILAGTIAQVTVHPLEVIRRCIQVQEEPSAKSLRLQLQTHSFIKVTRRLWSDGGIRRVYAGVTANCLKIVPSATISLLIRDSLLGRLKKHDSDLAPIMQ